MNNGMSTHQQQRNRYTYFDYKRRIVGDGVTTVPLDLELCPIRKIKTDNPKGDIRNYRLDGSGWQSFQDWYGSRSTPIQVVTSVEIHGVKCPLMVDTGDRPMVVGIGNTPEHIDTEDTFIEVDNEYSVMNAFDFLLSLLW